MKMYVIYLDIWMFGYLDIWIFGYLDIWIFGGGWSRNEIWTKTAYPDMSIISKFKQKIISFDIWKGFGDNMEHPNIWTFEHLNR